MYRRIRKTKTKIIAAAFLLAAALMGCAREDAAEEQGAGTTEGPWVQAGLEPGAEGQPDGEDQEEPQDALTGDNFDAAGETAGSNENQDIAPTASPKPSVEPFVDKLTEKGVGWGLGFGAAGEQPTGNASREELAQYEAISWEATARR